MNSIYSCYRNNNIITIEYSIDEMDQLPDDIITLLPQYLSFSELYHCRYTSRFWHHKYESSIDEWGRSIEPWEIAVEIGDVHLLSLLLNKHVPPLSVRYPLLKSGYLWLLMEASNYQQYNIVQFLAPRIEQMCFAHGYERMENHSILYRLEKHMIHFVSRYPQYFEMSHGREIRNKFISTTQLMEFWLDNEENMGNILNERPDEVLKVIMMTYILGYMNKDAFIYLRGGSWRDRYVNPNFLEKLDNMISRWNIK